MSSQNPKAFLVMSFTEGFNFALTVKEIIFCSNFICCKKNMGIIISFSYLVGYSWSCLKK